MPWFWPEEILIDGEEKIMLGLRKGRNSLKKTKHFYDLYHLRRKNCEWKQIRGPRLDGFAFIRIEKRRGKKS